MILLDIDRTIISGTAWFRACTVPGLLVPEVSIPAFLAANSACYCGRESTLSSEAFRSFTLELLERRIGRSFLTLLHLATGEDVEGLTEGSKTDDCRLRLAARYVLPSLHFYPEAVAAVDVLARLSDPSLPLRVLFLTRGYRPFAEVLAQEFMNRLSQRLRYAVSGSRLVFRDGEPREVFSLSQQRKSRIVRSLIANGHSISLLADDCADDPTLFELVKKQGGHALHIDYKQGQQRSTVWCEYLEYLNATGARNHIVRKIPLTPTRSHPLVSAGAMTFDRVGIPSIDAHTFARQMDRLRAFVADEGTIKELHGSLERLCKRSQDCVHLRSEVYYYWLPPVVTCDERSCSDRWKELIHLSKGFLASVRWEIVDPRSLRDVCALLFCSLDNLANGLLALMHSIETSEIEGVSRPTGTALLPLLDALLSDLYVQMYTLLRRREVSLASTRGLLEAFPWDAACDEFTHFEHCHRGMRELDDKQAIFESVELVLDESLKCGTIFHGIVTFPYGAIELGFALNAVARVRRGLSIPVWHCHFSSQKLRREKLSVDVNGAFLLSFIAHRHRERFVRAAREGAMVLLFDNNVTTFGTLGHARRALDQLGFKVRCAAVAANYDNFTRYALGQHAEQPISGWSDTLDFPVVREYVTAFNTWGTSEKARHLESLFARRSFNLEPTFSIHSRSNRILKVCRVHNIVDLGTALEAGATMIGIHAVRGDLDTYCRGEIAHGAPAMTVSSDESELPLAHFEVPAIRAMIRSIPAGLDVVLVVERAHDLSELESICMQYGLLPSGTFLQIQSRVTSDYLRGIADKFKGTIVTIGLEQHDFVDYLRSVSVGLDRAKDCLLVDMSKHQPDHISSRSALVKLSDGEKGDLLDRFAPALGQCGLRVFVADDSPVESLVLLANRLASGGVYVFGVDTQNALELCSEEQGYKAVVASGAQYHARVRKRRSSAAWWRRGLVALVGAKSTHTGPRHLGTGGS